MHLHLLQEKLILPDMPLSLLYLKKNYSFFKYFLKCYLPSDNIIPYAVTIRYNFFSEKAKQVTDIFKRLTSVDPNKSISLI